MKIKTETEMECTVEEYKELYGTRPQPEVDLPLEPLKKLKRAKKKVDGRVRMFKYLAKRVMYYTAQGVSSRKARKYAMRDYKKQK